MRKYTIELTQEQREELEKRVSSGRSTARSIQRARILLMSDNGPFGANWSEKQMYEAYGVSSSTIERTRKQFLAEGLQASISRRPQPERPEKRKINGEGEAHLLAQTCSPAPEGDANWSVRLLADRFVVLETGEKVGRETIRKVLKKTNSSRGKTRNGSYHERETGNS